MRPCGAQAGDVAALPGLGDGLPLGLIQRDLVLGGASLFYPENMLSRTEKKTET